MVNSNGGPMNISLKLVLTAALPLAFSPSAAPAAQPAEARVAATVETTLKSASGQIRQFAFDGDAGTYFASATNARAGDHFTLVFDKAVSVKSLAVTTGRPKGGDRLDNGTLEVSAD